MRGKHNIFSAMVLLSIAVSLLLGTVNVSKAKSKTSKVTFRVWEKGGLTVEGAVVKVAGKTLTTTEGGWTDEIELEVNKWYLVEVSHELYETYSLNHYIADLPSQVINISINKLNIDGRILSVEVVTPRLKQGETLEVEIEVKNTGNVKSDYHLYFGAGYPTDSKTITLDPGDKGKVTLSWVVPKDREPGDYTSEIRFEIAKHGGIWQVHKTWGEIQFTVEGEPEPKKAGVIVRVFTGASYDAGDPIPEAKVYIDGDYKGKTQSDGEINIGSYVIGSAHKIRVIRSGYKDFTSNFTVPDADISFLDVKMEKAFLDPSPLIVDVSFSPPGEIILGDVIEITIKGGNRGGFSPIGTLSLSFPQLDSPNDKGRVEVISNDAPETVIKAAGETIWHKDKGDIKASYLLVEAADTKWSNNGWESREIHELKIKVRPKDEGIFVVYCRITFKDNDSEVRFNYPTDSAYIDQQGFYVLKREIRVVREAVKREAPPGSLIRKYEPILKFHKDENDEELYFPMDADAYVQKCSLWYDAWYKPLPEKLKGEGEIETLKSLADFSKKIKKEKDLTRIFLQFIDYEEAKENAVLDEYKSAFPERYTYYARQFIEPDYSYLVIQYWFFYAYNSWGDYPFGYNSHEGDWEGITIFLHPLTKTPIYAAYSAHNDSGEIIRKPWKEIEREGTHPVVYVAIGSHANYFTSIPERKVCLIRGGNLICKKDKANGNGKIIRPQEWKQRVVLEDENYFLPEWAEFYEGRWGWWRTGIEAGFGAPKFPKFQKDNKWDHPAIWAGIQTPPPPVLKIISVETNKQEYEKGETVKANVKLEGECSLSNLVINLDIADPDGNNVREGIFKSIASLSPGGYSTGFLECWKIPEDAKAGKYIVTVGVWNENQTKQYDIKYGVASFTVKPKEITFVDSNLEAAIREAINKPDGPITKEDLANLTQLDASGRGIRNLSGLGYAINLEMLWLSDNQISDIASLSKLVNLCHLDLSNNQIDDVRALSGLGDFQGLILSHNQISDLSPLSEIGVVEWLDLSYNRISDISPLVANLGLGRNIGIDLRGNPLNDEAYSSYIPILQSRDVNVKFDPKLKPDLVISYDDISYNFCEEVITAVVHNIGETDASNVKIAFYERPGDWYKAALEYVGGYPPEPSPDDPPEAWEAWQSQMSEIDRMIQEYGETLWSPIAETSLNTIRARSSETASITWSMGEEGIFEIKVVVDPEDEIKEKNEQNNEATTWIAAKLYIAKPTSENPAQAGSYNNPSEISIIVAICVPETLPALADSVKDYFNVVIGGKEAEIVDIKAPDSLNIDSPITPLYAYELTVQPPVQEEAGLYDLNVSFFPPAWQEHRLNLSSSEKNAVFYSGSIEDEFKNSIFTLNVDTGASVDTNNLVAQLQEYNAHIVEDYVVWSKSSSDYKDERWNPSFDVTFKFALSKDGDFLVGVFASVVEALSALVCYNDWMPLSATTKDIFLNKVAWMEYRSLIERGLISGPEYSTFLPRIKNNLDSPVHIIYSLIFWAKDYNSEWRYRDLMDYWAPVPDPETYDGEGSRSFSIDYPSDVQNSFVYIIAHCDNGNVASAKLDSTEVVTQHDCGTSLYEQGDIYPHDIKLYGKTTWSEVDTSFHMILVGGKPSISNVAQSPDGAFNPLPSILTLSPGWNEYHENPVQPAPQTRKIVFVSDESGNPDIWIMDIDGSYRKQLTNDPKPEWMPRLSPDGSRIAYAKKDEDGTVDLWIMNADGTGQRKIYDGDDVWSFYRISWHPKGDKIYFDPGTYSGSGGMPHKICWVDPDGPPDQKEHDVLVAQNWYYAAPDISQDGRKIVFEHYKGHSWVFDTEIYVGDLSEDGNAVTNIKRLTQNSDADKAPLLSPDGSKIIWLHQAAPWDGGEVKFDIWTMDVNGNNPHSLTGEVDKETVQLGSFSLDGGTIIFSARRSGNWDIWRMKSDGTKLTQITDTPDINETSPDTNVIVKPPKIWGDVTGNGRVTAYDASRLLQYLVGKVSADEINLDVADVTGNGDISALDAAYILMFVVGKIKKFPVQGEAAPSYEGMSKVISIPTIRTKAGERIKVPIVIDDMKGILSGEMRIRYDPRALKLIKVSGMKGFEIAQNVGDDLVRLAFASSEEIGSGKGDLFQLEFEVARYVGNPSEVKIERVRINEGVKVKVERGKVEFVPDDTVLLQNYPNPCNPETWIPFQLAEGGDVRIRIYDMRGRLIKTLDLGYLRAGYYISKSSAAYWDGRNEVGERVASGVYIYQIQAGEKTFAKKMVILK